MNCSVSDSKSLLISINVNDGFLQDDFCFEVAMRLLPTTVQNEILKKKRFMRPTALGSQLLLLYGCSRILGCSWRELKFSKSKFGKPFLVHHDNVAFSMSNGGGNVIIYITKGEEVQGGVGIDIASTTDCINWEFEYLNDLKTVFSQSEVECLRSTSFDVRDELFTYYWSLKEAYIKYIGEGLNADLALVNLGSLKPLMKSEHRTFTKFINGKSVQFRSHWYDDCHIISICYKLKEPALDVKYVSLESISLSLIIDKLSNFG
ncbi:holo-[acyl-carrier-protein] synthase Ecym_3352 [Eremothecium cymbalariae DBVPG|uniref:holo-[acyl-carrier-protein] synthase n=1 Tax=Eremothecium cymbalariae (strain CBS 270.75 / DBVPG 7215 / KCTC 17166 / NRRL Y-17582) TaxID=931890 RepID=G8JRS1_ERECY|nr:Hypothetical protein Ecym_3352 [Eremothecium cymbalariae DBVPG\